MKIGIDLGGSHIAVGLVSNKGKVITKREKDFDNDDKQNIEKSIIKTSVKFIKEILEGTNISEIETIGIAAPGTIKDGIIIKAENLGIYNFQIVDYLKQETGYANIKLANDAKCAAICEKTYGTMKDFSDCVFLCLGTGIGGAVFLDNKLLQAKRFDGFELGHIVIEKNGIPCSCGNHGCFEKYASMKALKNRICKIKRI